ncbi:M14 family metallopeptidase [Alkalilimnicola ehrlichii MLHE-1]|uniref:Peptidase M14, carboxypeptidase A n=1 Tax=Alkalilimnicola ehrlichii (strain ATCC BAA-1101 / DSM 17681 / MLHE-1) TaxID=187272 RepID=Q0A7W4_ALKEH|nr:M14 family metallopeptidase [Alkalilimnicola ehrlichii]ABI57073.1 peptidase M14, carboxypeptidase A [Alkalilimnicola ehrlichii MLHE-1]
MGAPTDIEPFRHQYLDYDTLTGQLQHWASAHPEVARLESLGTSPEGREIWLLTVGRRPERSRPAVWVNGNMHGSELAGSSVALAVAEAALQLHLSGANTHGGLLPHLEEQLRGVLFYICPRVSPDGAEQVLHHGGFVRSAPRRSPHAPDTPRWEPSDLDGDGRCRYLRMEDPAGPFVASPRHAGLMLPRELDDPPPYYRLYPEGLIRHWDGHTVPEPEPLRDTPDFNRNFPWNWRPEPDQTGAGHFPGSEPETHAVLDFATRHPNIYAWLDLHTFGGVFIRPLTGAPDAAMDQDDLALYRQLAAWGEMLTGYPTVSGFEEFTYEPETPLYGDLTDFAYHQRACLAQVCELWDLFRRLDLPRPKRFVDLYTSLHRGDMERLAQWDAEHNRQRLFRPWLPLKHPQIGPVEVGGLDPSIGIWNPPPEALPDICDGIATYWLRAAALLPRLTIAGLECRPLGDDHWEIIAVVANHGYLPTYGVAAGRSRPWNDGVETELWLEGCTLTEGQPARQALGHLDGWGRGLGNMAHMPWFQRSRGSSHQARARWVVRGRGTVTLSVRSTRLGTLAQTRRLTP